jgi:hypothetical protein
MPRYHFNVYDGASSPDKEGIELADLTTARHDAVRLMGRLLLDDPDAVWGDDQWHLDVADGRGLTLFSLLLATVDNVATRAPGCQSVAPLLGGQPRPAALADDEYSPV